MRNSYKKSFVLCVCFLVMLWNFLVLAEPAYAEWQPVGKWTTGGVPFQGSTGNGTVTETFDFHSSTAATYTHHAVYTSGPYSGHYRTTVGELTGARPNTQTRSGTLSYTISRITMKDSYTDTNQTSTPNTRWEVQYSDATPTSVNIIGIDNVSRRYTGSSSNTGGGGSGGGGGGSSGGGGCYTGIGGLGVIIALGALAVFKKTKRRK